MSFKQHMWKALEFNLKSKILPRSFQIPSHIIFIAKSSKKLPDNKILTKWHCICYSIQNAYKKENVKVFLYHENCVFVFNLNLENFSVLQILVLLLFFFDKCFQNNLQFLDIYSLYNGGGYMLSFSIITKKFLN